MTTDPGGRQLLAIVTPVYCEQDLVQEFYQRATALKSLLTGLDLELIFVDDGSTDRSLEILTVIASTDPQVRVISLSRNFGHQSAITAGLDFARGDAVVVIDSDLQDPPEVIVEMVQKWREGFDVVYGQRRQRAGETAFKRWTAKLFYRLLDRLSDVKVPVDTGDFRLMDRKAVDALNELREDNRYIRGLVSWVGFKQAAVLYDRQERKAGKTKFSVTRMMNFALDGVSSFSDRPLRLVGQFGFIVTALSLLLALWVILGKLVMKSQIESGWPSLICVVLFMGGVQLISLGVIGEYIGRIFRQTKGRPLYVVGQTINLPRQTNRGTTGAGGVHAQ